MDLISVYGIYVGVGAVAGLASGLLGIGGGLVMVPVLLAGFAIAGIAPDAIPALSLGTSLSVVTVTSLIGSREHWRLGNLREPFSPAALRMSAVLVAGVVAGSMVAARMPRTVLLTGIALLQIAVALTMLRRKPATAPADAKSTAAGTPAALGGPGTLPYMAFTGLVSATGGIGGATLLVPYFTHRGLAFQQAAAWSTFFGCAIGATGAASYALLGHPPSPVPMAIGYVSMPAFACLALGSALLVRVGAGLSRRLSKVALTRGFCAILFVSGAKGLLPVLGAALAVGG